jgi:serine/threonine protein kinase
MGEAIARACLLGGVEAVSHGVPTFAVGELLAGRYRVEQLLARGGMGEVYLAFDTVFEQRLAIKTVLSTLSDNRGAVRRLCREVRLARRVQHPNVCRVHDIGVHAEDPRDVVYFMSMDFIEGQTLRALARAQRVAIPRVVCLARQILSGLDAVHSAGVLHRDVKSDNVMVSGEADSPLAVLVDFGLSRSLDGHGNVERTLMSGSVGYMAPEQLEGRTLSPRTDIFGFGVVLYEMLTGVLPFEAGRRRLASTELLGCEVCPSTLRPDTPQALDEVVERCLRYLPEERYRDVRSVLGDLQQLGAKVPSALAILGA